MEGEPTVPLTVGHAHFAGVGAGVVTSCSFLLSSVGGKQGRKGSTKENHNMEKTTKSTKSHQHQIQRNTMKKLLGVCNKKIYYNLICCAHSINSNNALVELFESRWQRTFFTLGNRTTMQWLLKFQVNCFP